MFGKLHSWFCRQHFLQCPQGVLNRHFEKLIQCDARLNFLSRQPEITLDSPHFHFYGRPSAYKNPDNLKYHDLNQVNGKGSATSRFQDIGSSHSLLSPSFKIEQNSPPGISLDSLPCEASSHSSGTERTWLVMIALFIGPNVSFIAVFMSSVRVRKS